MTPQRELSLLEHVANDMLISGGKEDFFEQTLYFCPVPKVELQEYLRHLPLDHTSDEYHQLELRKRGQLSHIYNSLAGLMFSVMHTDSLRTMKRSQGILHERVDKENAQFKRLEQLAQDADDLGNKLFQIPILADAAKYFSDIVQEYNGIVREHHFKTFGMSGEEVFGLYCSYGVRYGPGHYNTFEEIVDKLGMRKGLSQFDDFHADRLGMHLSVGNIRFIMRSRPHTDRSICEAYAISYGSSIPEPLEPAQITISIQGKKTIYAAMLTKVYENVLKRFDHEAVRLLTHPDLPYSDIVLAYCPADTLRMDESDVRVLTQ